MTGSIDKYNYIIDVYEGEITSDYKTLLDDVKTETTTMHNDTPQNEGDWLDFSHTSYATKISSSSNTNTKVARVEEILQAVRSIFETWCKEFGKFVFEV